MHAHVKKAAEGGHMASLWGPTMERGVARSKEEREGRGGREPLKL